MYYALNSCLDSCLYLCKVLWGRCVAELKALCLNKTNFGCSLAGKSAVKPRSAAKFMASSTVTSGAQPVGGKRPASDFWTESVHIHTHILWSGKVWRSLSCHWPETTDHTAVCVATSVGSVAWKPILVLCWRFREPHAPSELCTVYVCQVFYFSVFCGDVFLHIVLF